MTSHPRRWFGALARWVVRTSVMASVVIVVVAVLAGLVLTGRSHLVLGQAIEHADGLPVDPNPELVDATSVLDLSDGGVDATVLPPRTVAITFDDGPDPVWTPKVQAVLDLHDVPGTFFMIGERVLQHPDILRGLDAAGHEIGNHTFTHARLGLLQDWQVETQIALTQRAVVGAIGKRPTSFRPPYSGRSEYLQPDELEAARVATSGGLFCLLTDKVVPDYDPTISVDQLVRGAMPRNGEGFVLTFHDGGGDRQNTVAALERLIPELKSQGYDFVLVSELTGANSEQGVTASDAWLASAMLRGAGTVVTAAHLLLIVGVVYAVLGTVRCIVLLVFADRNRRRRSALESAMDHLPPVTVIVPAYNEAVGIEAAVRSLAESDYPDLEVIVVDDGSSDDTAKIAARLGLSNVRVIRQTNGGKPSALNTGIRFASHDIVVMVDGDTIIEPITVRRLVQPFADPDVGAVAGNPRVGNRRGFLAALQHLEYVVSSSLERRMFDELGAMLCIPGAIGAFRRRAVTAVGGVSVDTLAEDTDLTMALTRAGWRIAYVPHARAYTEVPTTWRGLYLQRFRWSYGILQAIAKHRRSIIERGRSGVLGRRVVPYTLVFGYVSALTAPATDLLAVYSLTSGAMEREALLLALVVNGVAIATALCALRLEGEKLRHAWALPLQVVIYRQVMYVVSLRSMWCALLGVRLRWNSIARQGGLRIATPVVDLRGPEIVIDVRAADVELPVAVIQEARQ